MIPCACDCGGSKTNELREKLREFCRLEHGFVMSREYAFLTALIDLRDPIDMDRSRHAYCR
jgi:hypothetical protein